jgi:hypothetical protein
MSDIPFETASVTEIVDRRDAIVDAVRDHAGGLARDLARLQGGDYGRKQFKTDDGTWTVKYEAGDLEFLRFEGARTDVYLVSTKQPPEAEPLATALTDYESFIESWNEFVESRAGMLADVPGEFPSPASTQSVVAERDRIATAIRETADEMAAELHAVEASEYGTFAARVDGTRWELNRDADRTSYLRVGGEGGSYLVSQYGPPSAETVREYAAEFEGFLDAFEEHLEELEAELTAEDA